MSKTRRFFSDVQLKKKEKSPNNRSDGESQASFEDKNKKEIIVQKKLEMGPVLKLVPSNAEEKQLVAQALKERHQTMPRQPSMRIQKQPTDSTQIKVQQKKGATRPSKSELFRSLLYRKNDPKTRRYGIGNAAIGMKFKSVYLGQGRSNTDS